MKEANFARPFTLATPAHAVYEPRQTSEFFRLLPIWSLWTVKTLLDERLPSSGLQTRDQLTLLAHTRLGTAMTDMELRPGHVFGSGRAEKPTRGVVSALYAHLYHSLLALIGADPAAFTRRPYLILDYCHRVALRLGPLTSLYRLYMTNRIR